MFLNKNRILFSLSPSTILSSHNEKFEKEVFKASERCLDVLTSHFVHTFMCKKSVCVEDRRQIERLLTELQRPQLFRNVF